MDAMFFITLNYISTSLYVLAVTATSQQLHPNVSLKHMELKRLAAGIPALPVKYHKGIPVADFEYKE